MSDRIAYKEEQNRLAMAHTLRLRSLDLHLQAKVRVETSRLDAFELLLRGHDDAGAVPPPTIIERMRKSGQELDFALAITARALQISQALHANGLRVPVAFNLDEVDLFVDGLPQSILELIERRAPHERAVEIEITEHDRTNDPEEIAKALAPFAERQMRIWIDDAVLCGKALEEDLRRMHALPVRGIKLDRSLISQDDPARPLRHAKHFAALHGIEELVLEGVETDGHLEWCRAHRIPVAQGYRFHRPECLESAMTRFS